MAASTRLTVRLKGLSGRPVRDVLGAACAPVVIRAKCGRARPRVAATHVPALRGSRTSADSHGGRSSLGVDCGQCPPAAWRGCTNSMRSCLTRPDRRFGWQIHSRPSQRPTRCSRTGGGEYPTAHGTPSAFALPSTVTGESRRRAPLRRADRVRGTRRTAGRRRTRLPLPRPRIPVVGRRRLHLKHDESLPVGRASIAGSATRSPVRSRPSPSSPRLASAWWRQESPDWQPHSRRQNTAILAGLGLRGEFWRLQ